MCNGILWAHGTEIIHSQKVIVYLKTPGLSTDNSNNSVIQYFGLHINWTRPLTLKHGRSHVTGLSPRFKKIPSTDCTVTPASTIGLLKESAYSWPRSIHLRCLLPPPRCRLFKNESIPVTCCRTSTDNHINDFLHYQLKSGSLEGVFFAALPSFTCALRLCCNAPIALIYAAMWANMTALCWKRGWKAQL